MDAGTITFFVVLMVFSLGLGISGFIGNKAEAYSGLSFSSRLLFAGVLILLFLTVGLINTPTTETGTYLISYICFALGVVGLVGGVVFSISKKASNFWWRLVRRQEQKNDRNYLIWVSFLLSFAFFFAFFLFYPPFISIG